MKISELIETLETLKNEYGDVEVTTYEGSSDSVQPVKVYKREIRKPKKRERKRYYKVFLNDEPIYTVVHIDYL